MSSGWRQVTLGDLEVESLGTIQTGPFGSQLHASDYSEIGTPVVMPTNIRQRRISTEGIARVSDEHVNRLSRHQLRAGDIVYSRRGDVEKCALVTDHEAGWLCGTGCLLVRVGSDSVDPRCLSYALALPETRNWISQHAVGATMPNLNTEVLREVPVNLPPVDEQRSIAATLGALDDKIDSDRRAIRSLRDLAISTLNGDPIERRFVVGDVASIKKGVSYKGSGLTSEGVGVPMVNMGSAANYGWLKRSGFKHYSGDFKPRHVAPPESLMITSVEQTWKQEIIGWPLLVPDDIGDVLFTHHMLLVDFDDEHEWLRLPLWAQLFTDGARAALEGSIYGTTVATLPASSLESISFAAPAPASGVIPAARSMLQKCWSLEREIGRLAALRDSLLLELMSGRLRVPEARGIFA